jgi:hypothetical protein
MSGAQHKRLWKRFTLKERNDKICRLRVEGMKVSILSERFGISGEHVRKILKGAGRWTTSPV